MDNRKRSINERINPQGKTPHNPVLRWTPGDRHSVYVASGLTPLPDGEREASLADYDRNYADYFGPDDGEPLTEEEWGCLLDNTIFAE